MKTYTIRTRSTGSDNFATCGKLKASCTQGEREAVERLVEKIISHGRPAARVELSWVRRARITDKGWQPGEWLLKVDEIRVEGTQDDPRSARMPDGTIRVD